MNADREPYITLTNPLPGIVGLAAFKAETGAMIAAFAHHVLRGPSSLTPGEREVIAAYVSSGNETYFCAHTHAAVARHLIGPQVGQVVTSVEDAPVSDKVRALMRIADKVRRSGLEVTPDDVEAARQAGASDEDVHDAVLVAAAFCMFNRYVDGLAAVTPRDDALYDQIGQQLARNGYRPGPAG
jgi:uncharacterized peroxidase-related enzyme